MKMRIVDHATPRRTRIPFTFSVLAMVIAAAFLIQGCSGDPADVEDDEPDDVTPPATVADLRVTAVTPSSLNLQWTAPGDDGSEGFAASYDLRGSEEAITPENFAAAVVIDLDQPPLPPGAVEDVLIDPLEEGRTYYFALKTRDDAGNVSGLSNCAHGTCPLERTISVPDANLMQLLRESLEVPTGDIRLSDILRLIHLEGNERGIVELTGLEEAVNLKGANLLGNQISDPSPVGHLSGLEDLNLTMNQISDLSPLQDLDGLVGFGCGQNQVTDISVVANMTHLRRLSVHHNPLADLSPIASLDLLEEINVGGLGLADLTLMGGMTHLRIVVAGGNLITDIATLASLPELEEVFLAYNQLADLGPLVANAAFAEGAYLDVRGNPLSQAALDEQIPALAARGVTVVH